MCEILLKQKIVGTDTSIRTASTTLYWSHKKNSVSLALIESGLVGTAINRRTTRI